MTRHIEQLQIAPGLRQELEGLLVWFVDVPGYIGFRCTTCKARELDIAALSYGLLNSETAHIVSYPRWH